MSDHLFPRYHVRPPTGYLNDPNGPILVGGLAHLYFQHRHDVEHGSPVHWGHVTSRDLVHWDHHRPAIVPHPLLPDQDGCWSGNTVADPAGGIRAFYSGHVDGARPQSTLSAVTADGGYSFGPPLRIVPDPPAGEDIRELRDPFVWREGSSWWMALGAGTGTGTAMVRLYASDDLDTWDYCGPMATLRRTRTPAWDSGAMWECPQIITFGDRRVAVVGSWGPDRGVMDALSFAVPDRAAGPGIEPSAVHLVDRGPNFYAPSVLIEGVDSPVMWGWATEGRSHDWCRADGWSGMLSLPRMLSLRPDGALASSPLPAMSRLRADRGRQVDGELGDVGAQFEFALEGLGAGSHGVRLAFGDGEFLVISVDGGTGGVTVDRDHASSDSRADRGVVVIDRDAAVTADGMTEPVVRGFVDGSILELFLPGGTVATMRFYPTTSPPWRIELLGASGSARLRVWELSTRTARPA